MLLFKDYLLEFKIDTVYHVTNIDSAFNILTHDYFRTRINSETNKQGLSTTFDKNYLWGGGAIRFVLDLNKLKKNYKTEKVNSIVGVDESEILILSDSPITHCHKYIKGIDILKKKDSSYKVSYETIVNKIEEYKKVYNI